MAELDLQLAQLFFINLALHLAAGAETFRVAFAGASSDSSVSTRVGCFFMVSEGRKRVSNLRPYCCSCFQLSAMPTSPGMPWGQSTMRTWIL
jgi:hypothetical protein